MRNLTILAILALAVCLSACAPGRPALVLRSPLDVIHEDQPDQMRPSQAWQRAKYGEPRQVRYVEEERPRFGPRASENPCDQRDGARYYFEP